MEQDNVNIGDKVVYTDIMKGLPPNSIGIITNIYGDKATVSYPQYSPKEVNGKYIFSNYVYAHSALISEIKL